MFRCAPNSLCTGCPRIFPFRSHSAISIAPITARATPLRPHRTLPQYILSQILSVSRGSSPTTSGLNAWSISIFFNDPPSGPIWVSVTVVNPVTPSSVVISRSKLARIAGFTTVASVLSLPRTYQGSDSFTSVIFTSISYADCRTPIPDWSAGRKRNPRAVTLLPGSRWTDALSLPRG